jgi:glycerate dehydrogenase
MSAKPSAVFLDFGTMGPGIDTAPLDALLDVRYFDHTPADQSGARLQDCRVALLNKTKLDATTIEQAHALELIAVSATGTDNVDLVAAENCGVAVANIRDYCSASVAQHVFGLILALNQQILEYDRLVRNGAWSHSPVFALFDYPLRELAGCSLGIVGYGALGRATANIGRCLGMEILISARPGIDGAAPDGRIPFETVLERADVLSLHCPLTKDTHHLLGAEEFRRMRKNAIVINTARGALIKPRALVDALRAGTIGGAGIDVLQSEPPPTNDPLLEPNIPNLLMTPHIAWAAIESRQRAIAQVSENVASFLGSEKLRRVV